MPLANQKIFESYWSINSWAWQILLLFKTQHER